MLFILTLVDVTLENNKLLPGQNEAMSLLNN